MSEDERTAWCSFPDHYVVHGVDLEYSSGFQVHHDFLAAERRLLESHEPLRGLELFAGRSILQIPYENVKKGLGAGGFGTGLAQSRHIKTLWAIEWDKPAATTYRLVER